jgi:hypothetical protein
MVNLLDRIANAVVLRILVVCLEMFLGLETGDDEVERVDYEFRYGGARGS